MSDSTPAVEEKELSDEEQAIAVGAFEEGCEYGYNQYAEDLVRCLRRMAKESGHEDAETLFDMMAQAIENGELIKEQDTEEGPCDVSELVSNLDLN